MRPRETRPASHTYWPPRSAPRQGRKWPLPMHSDRDAPRSLCPINRNQTPARGRGWDKKGKGREKNKNRGENRTNRREERTSHIEKWNRERKERVRGSLKPGREVFLKQNREDKRITTGKRNRERKNEKTRGEGKRKKSLSLRRLNSKHRYSEPSFVSHDTATGLHRSTASEAARPATHHLLRTR